MKRRRAVLISLALGLALRLAYGLSRPMGARPSPDPDGYIAMARSFARTGTLALADGVPSAHREPGYPVAVGLVMKVLGTGWGAVLAANLLFSLLALLALYRVGERLYGERVAMIALAVAALYPPFVYYANQPMREVLMILLSTAAVLGLVEALRLRKASAFAGAGAAGAAAALTNSAFLPFAGSAPFLLFLFPKTGLRKAGPWAAAYLAVFAAVVALWPLRNYVQFKRLVVGSTAGGGSVFYGNLAAPQEAGGTPGYLDILEKDPVVRASRGLDPIDRDKFFWKAGFGRVREAPGRFLRLAAWRLLWDQWRVVPRPRAYEHSYRALWWAGLLSDGWIIPLAFIGMALAGLKAFEAVWAWWLVGSVSLVYALIFTMLRYRVPLMPWMILYASYALDRAWRRWAR